MVERIGFVLSIFDYLAFNFFVFNILAGFAFWQRTKWSQLRTH